MKHPINQARPGMQEHIHFFFFFLGGSFFKQKIFER